jgi:hypothetical protein
MRHSGIRLDTFFTRLRIPFILHKDPFSLPKNLADQSAPILIHRPSYAGDLDFSIKSPVKISGISYDIDCALIKLSSDMPRNNEKHENHLIFGYVYKGKRYIRDSNGPNSFECDWLDTKNIVTNAKYRKFSVSTYGSGWSLAYYITNIWIRSDQMADATLFQRDPGGISPVYISERIRILIIKQNAAAINKSMMASLLRALKKFAESCPYGSRMLNLYRSATTTAKRMAILNRAARPPE